MLHRPRTLAFRMHLIVLIGMFSVTPRAMQCQARWTIEPNLRIGAVDDGPASFADIRGVAVGERGSIWVLDFNTQTIRMFDAQGQFIKIVARSGGGPGEIRRANGMLTGRNGDVWVNDPANSRLTVFTPDGRYKTQHMLKAGGAAFFWNAIVDAEGRINEEIRLRNASGTFVPGVRRVAPNGTPVDTLPMPLCRTEGVDSSRAYFRASAATGDNISVGVPFLPTAVTAWDQRSAIWCSGGARYEVIRITIGKLDTTARILHRANSVAVTAEERLREIATIHKRFAALGFADPDFDWIPQTKPAIVALDKDGEGRLWVRQSATDTTTTAFHVWNEAGSLLAIAQSSFRVSPFRHLLIRGDTLYAVTTDQDDVPYVVRAVIRR